jgi:hypothetical protein
MALHITVLIGFRNRLAVLSSWIYSYIFFRRGSRLITGLTPAAVKQPIAPSLRAPLRAPDAPMPLVSAQGARSKPEPRDSKPTSRDQR